MPDPGYAHASGGIECRPRPGCRPSVANTMKRRTINSIEIYTYEVEEINILQMKLRKLNFSVSLLSNIIKKKNKAYLRLQEMGKNTDWFGPTSFFKEKKTRNKDVAHNFLGYIALLKRHFRRRF